MVVGKSLQEAQQEFETIIINSIRFQKFVVLKFKKMNNYFAQHAKMTVKPNMRDEVIQLLNKSAELLDRIPGCVYYLISIPEEPDVVWVSELWTSKEAKDALAASPETTKTMKELMPFIASVTDRTGMRVVGGFGMQ